MLIGKVYSENRPIWTICVAFSSSTSLDSRRLRWNKACFSFQLILILQDLTFFIPNQLVYLCLINIWSCQAHILYCGHQFSPIFGKNFAYVSVQY
ncbi:hypothetical protein BpHYR1_023745 [Brachionus plicatilis]|uniref:Uncharacterized protein n=1 Tax=Brachionus plicatilis TaxID=10195 RepID=A0A3M7RQB2_BRAPC|nr:hypothetical protein BpHYR1_023745 [Brachionus plicatilis]